MKKGCENIVELQGKFSHTYLDGVYLAVNAIKGAYLLLDAPVCGYDKMFSFYRTHDLFSDLFRQDSRHRICCSGIHPDRNMQHDRSEELSELLRRIASEHDCGAVLVCSMPVATITGAQYDLIINRNQGSSKVPFIEVPSKSLQSDWLGGYEETLLAVANKLKLKSNAKKKDTVAIVGYLFDRNEGDHVGNLKELSRMLQGISLKLSSVWLSGSPFGALRDVEKAGTIISLPYGRKAARKIAEKTGAGIIELDLPLGLDNTSRWLSAIARRLNKTKQLRSFLDRELSALIPVSNLVVPEYILGKKFSLYADPYLAHALAGAFIQAGGRIEHAVIFGRPGANENLSSPIPFDFKTIYEPTYGEVFGLDMSNVDVFVGNSQIFNLLRVARIKKPYIEIGYPSLYHHCLTMNSFLGFRGYINLLNRVVNSQRRIYDEG